MKKLSFAVHLWATVKGEKVKRIHYKIPAKTYLLKQLRSPKPGNWWCVRLRMNEVCVRSIDFCFQKHINILVRDGKHLCSLNIKISLV